MAKYKRIIIDCKSIVVSFGQLNCHRGMTVISKINNLIISIKKIIDLFSLNIFSSQYNGEILLTEKMKNSNLVNKDKAKS